MTDHELTTRDLAGRSGTVDETRKIELAHSTRPRRDGSHWDGSHRCWCRARAERRPSADVGRGAKRTPVAADGPTDHGPLLPDDQGRRFIERWQVIQASFVDEPRQSVEQADALVADLMQRLAAGFSSERERLEGQWDRGDDVSTEDLRVALTRYRSFFDRLLAA